MGWIVAGIFLLFAVSVVIGVRGARKRMERMRSICSGQGWRFETVGLDQFKVHGRELATEWTFSHVNDSKAESTSTTFEFRLPRDVGSFVVVSRKTYELLTSGAVGKVMRWAAKNQSTELAPFDRISNGKELEPTWVHSPAWKGEYAVCGDRVAAEMLLHNGAAHAVLSFPNGIHAPTVNVHGGKVVVSFNGYTGAQLEKELKGLLNSGRALANAMTNPRGHI